MANIVTIEDELGSNFVSQEESQRKICKFGPKKGGKKKQQSNDEASDSSYMVSQRTEDNDSQVQIQIPSPDSLFVDL